MHTGDVCVNVYVFLCMFAREICIILSKTNTFKMKTVFITILKTVDNILKIYFNMHALVL